jgi:hypothetical protein
MTEITQKPTWLWRRVLTYATCAVAAIVALVAVWRAPDPTNIGIAAIIVGWLAQTVYVTGAVFEDFTRLTRAAADGLRGIKDMTQ